MQLTNTTTIPMNNVIIIIPIPLFNINMKKFNNIYRNALLSKSIRYNKNNKNTSNLNQHHYNKNKVITNECNTSILILIPIPIPIPILRLVSIPPT